MQGERRPLAWLAAVALLCQLVVSGLVVAPVHAMPATGAPGEIICTVHGTASVPGTGESDGNAPGSDWPGCPCSAQCKLCLSIAGGKAAPAAWSAAAFPSAVTIPLAAALERRPRQCSAAVGDIRGPPSLS